MRERSIKQNYGTYLALDGMTVFLGMILELLELRKYIIITDEISSNFFVLTSIRPTEFYVMPSEDFYTVHL